MDKRFAAAMTAFALLALAAGVTLTGLLRSAVWVFLAGMAVKTWIASHNRP